MTLRVVKKISGCNEIEISGIIYYIPDTFTPDNTFSEHRELYKFLLCQLLHSGINTSDTGDISDNTLESLQKLKNKKYYNKILNDTEKLYSYIITGKINTGINLSNTEKDIIAKIPIALIPKINPNVVEMLE